MATIVIPVPASIAVHGVGGEALSKDAQAAADAAALKNATDEVAAVAASDKSVFGESTTTTRLSLISARFDIPIAGQAVTVAPPTGGGAVTQANSTVLVSSGAPATGSAGIATSGPISYQPGRELYALFTAAFTPPTHASSDQRIGIFDAQNGFFVGYHGLAFGVTERSAGVDTFTPLSSANLDTLTGGTNSRFKRGAVPEALDPTLLNVFRIRFGWLGSATILFELMAPSGLWVGFHAIRQPNTSATPSIQHPNLPITAEAIKSGADATDLVVHSASWDAGVAASPTSVTQPVSATALPLPAGAATEATLAQVRDSLPSSPGFFYHINANGTYFIKASSGRLRCVVVGTPGKDNVATFYNNTAASGAVLTVVNATNGPVSLPYNGDFTVGLTVAVAGGTPADWSVVGD